MKLRSLSLVLGVGLALGPGAACAIGLGDLQGEPVIGQRLELSIPLLGSEGLLPDAACFRLVQLNDGDDLPWVRNVSLVVKGGAKPVLELRGAEVIREPVLRLLVDLACGHELRREYLLLASPPRDLRSDSQGNGQGAVGDKAAAPVVRAHSGTLEGKRESVGQASAPPSTESKPRPKPKLKPKRTAAPSGGPLPDRLMLSAGDGNLEPVLRLSTVLGENLLVDDLAEAKREVLRLEFRVLMSLHEQAVTQLAAAEKIRQMEGDLLALQQAVVVPQAANVPVAPVPPAAPVVAAPQPTLPPPPVPSDREVKGDFWLDWGVYLLLIGVLLGLGAWLFWRYYRESRGRQAMGDYFAIPPVLQESPPLEPEKTIVKPAVKIGEQSGVSLDLDLGAPVGERARPESTLDLDLGFATGDMSGVALPSLENGVAALRDTPKELPGFTEPNPVMELADIMLSFGRVKGAAQALQEYIDNNPQEALQPWIRLMDVYRMADMRDEFEEVARNLNQHFNVEVQSWGAPRTSEVLDFVLDTGTTSVVAPQSGPISETRPLEPGLEDMSRIMECVVRLWPDDEYVLEYLNQLLRDNRGGQRQGFALTVVDDILFLVELKETIASMDRESDAAL